MKNKIQTRQLSAMAMLCALAYAVMVPLRFSMVAAAPFLKYDPKDIILVIGGFIYGPISALVMSVVVSFMEMVTVSESGPIGMVMNILSSCAFVCAAAFIYKRKRTILGAVIGLAAGVVFATGVMLLWDYFMIPLYNPYVTRAAVVEIMLPAILPFNLVKGGINAAIVMLIYKQVVTALRGLNLTPDTQGAKQSSGTSPKNKKLNAGVLIASMFVLATCVMLALVLKGII